MSWMGACLFANRHTPVRGATVNLEIILLFALLNVTVGSVHHTPVSVFFLLAVLSFDDKGGAR